jgi:SAM-dependent methyltransferase
MVDLRTLNVTQKHSRPIVLIRKFLSVYPVGLLCFRAAVLQKWFGSLRGKWSQRMIEYPWIMNYLKTSEPNLLVLDVGCSESLFDQFLVHRRFRVVGLDIRDNLFPTGQLTFVKGDIMNTGLPAEAFDVVCIISTIEHVGLSAYDQQVRDSDGDIQALHKVSRILKKNGRIIITTPFVGAGGFRVNSFERNYDRKRLQRLIAGFRILKEDYFYPYKVGNRLAWAKLTMAEIDRMAFLPESPGIACLVLSKT